MSSANMREKLSGHAFLAGCSPALLDMLSGLASVKSYAEREMIFQEGDEATEFHLLIQGRVAIEIFAPERGPVAIETINSHEVLGWSWLVEPHRWVFDAQAVEPTQAIVIDARKIREQMSSDVALGYELLRRFIPVIARRLQATRMQVLDLYHVRT